MKKTLTSILLLTASYLSLSISPARLSDEEIDVGIFRKNSKESIENNISISNNTHFDDLKYRFVIEEVSSNSTINNIHGRIYALLLNGTRNEQDEGNTRFENNIKMMHDALSNIGVDKDKIFVVQDEQSGKYNKRFNPTIEGLEDALSHLNIILKEDDLLIFYMTNHGNTNIDDSEYHYLLENDTLNEDYLLNKINETKVGATWIINATCKAYIMTSKATGKTIGHSFTGPHKNAVGGATRELAKTLNTAAANKELVDIDKDGLISIMEIAKYTALNYTGTIYEGMPVGEDYRREVHYITYQDADPKNIILK